LPNDNDQALKRVSVAFAILRTLDCGPTDPESLQQKVANIAGPAITNQLFHEALAGLAANGYVRLDAGLWTATGKGAAE
jgi:hypothetical protein